MRNWRSALLGVALFVAACQQPADASEQAVSAPAADSPSVESTALQSAIFAGGCFWGVEGVFSHVRGVTSAVSGYHGGTRVDATYEAVSGGGTGHAEAVKVTFDPKVVRYDHLLRIFFSVVADPTLKNRQGPDVGTQYRAALVPLDAEQARVAAAYIRQLGKSGLWSRPIVTRVERYRAFYPAESYHQDFMARHPRHPYIQRWDAPKVAALKALFPQDYRSTFQPG